MVPYSKLTHPLLEVKINGSLVTHRPSAFTLLTDEGFPAVIARLSYPAAVTAGSPGQALTISLVIGDVKNLLFSGTIFDAKVRGALKELSLTDGYKRLRDTLIYPAYRRELAERILTDTLEAAGISESAIACPTVELARFSLPGLSATSVISLLIKALEEHGQAGIRYFFDAANTFRFGTIKDSGGNTGEVFALESGKNIIKKGPGWVETFPLPIRHSQALSIDGVRMIATRSDLCVSRSRSRLVLWVKEV